MVRITDCLTLRSGADLGEDTAAGRGELLRSVVVLHGRVRLQVELEPRGGATAETHGRGFRIRTPRRPELDLRLVATVPLEGLHTTVDLRQGEQAHFLLRWAGAGHRRAFSRRRCSRPPWTGGGGG